MVFVKNPNGKANLLIFDNSYRVPQSARNLGKRMDSERDFAKFYDADLRAICEHADGLLKLIELSAGYGNPVVCAIEETVKEIEKSNTVLGLKLEALPWPSDLREQSRLRSVSYYLSQMKHFGQKMSGANPVSLLNGRSHRYHGRFLQVARDFYKEIVGEQSTLSFGEQLETDNKIVAASCALLYRENVNNIVVLTRDTKHIAKMIGMVVDRIFLGGEGKKYNLNSLPQKDFSISCHSGSIPELFNSGLASSVALGTWTYTPSAAATTTA